MVQPHADLPVAVDLPGRLGSEVAAFAEAEAGWQIVAVDGPLVPAFTLRHQVQLGGPTAVVLDTRPDAAAAREALLAGALDVIVWPEERERLLCLPERVRPQEARHGRTPLLTVAGTRGGAGTSTVALTVAATVAWAGGQALCVGGSGLVRLAGVAPWAGPGTAEVVALGRHAAVELPGLSRDVPGVPGLAVLGGGGALTDVSGWPYDLVVHDVGTSSSAAADVMVAAADAAVDAASGAAVVLVVEHGPLNRAAVATRLGRTPEAWLPYSNRVAKAGSVGRVPSALPGSWVATVQQGLAGALR